MTISGKIRRRLVVRVLECLQSRLDAADGASLAAIDDGRGGLFAGHRAVMPHGARDPPEDQGPMPNRSRPEIRLALRLELPPATMVLTLRERWSSQVSREGSRDGQHPAPDIKRIGRPGARMGIPRIARRSGDTSGLATIVDCTRMGTCTHGSPKSPGNLLVVTPRVTLRTA